jgi:hypothetical protein
VLALVTLAGLAGCGIDEDVVAREAAEAGPVRTTGTTSTTVVEGVGEAEVADDVRPVTVLGPDGVATGPATVLVEAVAPGAEEGYRDAPGARGWDSLTEGSVRVSAIAADEDELRQVLDGAEPPPTPGAAPVVPDPPGILEVVGAITADGVAALIAAPPAADDDPVPGPPSAHVAAWSAPDGGSLLVMTLPAGALDPAAVVTEARPPRRVVDEERDAVAEEVTVGDATGIVTTTARPSTGDVVRRELALVAPWGDVLLVVSRGPAELDADALVAVAESVTPTS